MTVGGLISFRYDICHYQQAEKRCDKYIVLKNDDEIKLLQETKIIPTFKVFPTPLPKACVSGWGKSHTHVPFLLFSSFIFERGWIHWQKDLYDKMVYGFLAVIANLPLNGQAANSVAVLWHINPNCMWTLCWQHNWIPPKSFAVLCDFRWAGWHRAKQLRMPNKNCSEGPLYIALAYGKRRKAEKKERVVNYE